jgi:RNA polymerase primary sigma factor
LTNARSSITNYLGGLYRTQPQPLPLEEEERLAGMIAAGDQAALDKLIRHNLRFVVSVVKETPAWHHGVVPFEDLIAMGNEALIRAARRWVPKNNARFATYAKPFIIKGVRRALDNEWALIRVPVNIAEEIRRMKYAERVLTQELRRAPTDEELADRLLVHVSRLDELRACIVKEPTSIESFNQEKFKEESEE